MLRYCRLQRMAVNAFPSRAGADFSRFWRLPRPRPSLPWVAVVTVLTAATVVTAATGAKEPEAAAEEYRRLVQSLRERFPNRDAVLEGYGPITSELRGFMERHPTAPELGKARRLTAEVQLLGGEDKVALELWVDLVRYGPADEDRALGLYLLGEYSFLRARPDSRQARHRQARQHLTSLRERFPDSRWAAAAAGPLGYLELIETKKPPEFEATFERQGDKTTYSLNGLRGKVVLLVFWKASSPGQRPFEAQLSKDIARTLVAYPTLQENVVVLQVNLDTDRNLFDAAVRQWNITSLQVHDGMGFETPLARTFHIPRAPHFVVIDPDTSLTYLGGSAQDFFKRASSALKERRRRSE